MTTNDPTGMTVDGPPAAEKVQARRKIPGEPEAFPGTEFLPQANGQPSCRFKRGESFWFHDETGDEHGPFWSIEEMDHELGRYVHYLETGRMTPSYHDREAAPWMVIDQLAKKLLREHILPNDFGNHPLHTELLLFISEVIEIFEDERKGITESAKLPGFLAVEEEAADIVLRVLSASAKRGWRLGEAMMAKHAYNLTRPYKHGKTL